VKNFARITSLLSLAMVFALVAFCSEALAQPGPEIRVTACETRADQPDIAIDSAGNSHIVYFDECGTMEREIFYSMLDSDGNILIDQTQLTVDDDNSDKHPAVVVDSDDMVLPPTQRRS